jgi:WD40 repeat protein
MYRIFISHSSKDRDQAEMVLKWLRQEDYEAFLDSDIEMGITAGSDWKEQLKIRLDQCKVLIAICSQNFRESDWCRLETDIAFHEGKDIISVIVDDSELIRPLKTYQAIKLSQGIDDARQRLMKGLELFVGSERDVHWDPKRSPYPGLDPFMEADEAIFFGRQQEIMAGVELLRILRRERDTSMMVVIGASGSGKSSLVRAGIIPKVKRDPEGWIVLTPFRPGQQPFRELAIRIVDAYREYSVNKEVSDVIGKLDLSPIDLCLEIIDELRKLTGKSDGALLITIDQFEELLDLGGKKSDLTSESNESASDAFLDFLQIILNSKTLSGKLLILGTLRSDYLDAFLQSNSKFKDIKYKEFILRPMAEENFHQVIEEPAKRGDIGIDAELVEMMIADTKTGDALPLLAYTLRALLEKKLEERKENSRVALILKKSDYIEIGRIEGVIQKRAEDIFHDHCPKGKEIDVRNAFLRMVRSNPTVDHMGWVKRAATWKYMPLESLDILDRYVTARLLVKRAEETGVFVEPAHEALLRNWERLREWIKENNDFLLWREHFDSDFLPWRDSRSPIKDYLAGAKLLEAEKWRTRFPEHSQERQFIDKSIRRRSFFKGVKISLVVCLAAGLAYSLHLWQNAREAETDQLRIRQLSTVEIDPYSSGIAGLAAMQRFALRPGLNYQITRGLEQAIAANLARTNKLNTQLLTISAMALSPDGRLIISGRQEGRASLFEVNKKGDGSLDLNAQHKKTEQTRVVKLHFSKDGRKAYGLGYTDFAFFLTTWDKRNEKVDEQEIFGSNEIAPETLSFIPGDELLLAANGSADGKFYLWSDGEAVQSLNGIPFVTAFISLNDGKNTLISSHKTGPLRKWEVKQENGKPHLIERGTLNNDAALTTLTTFKEDGQTIIVAGGENGVVKIWKGDKEVQKIEGASSGQGRITSLLSLPSGDVITGDDRSLVRWWKWDGKEERLRPVTEMPFDTRQSKITGLAPLPGDLQSIRTVISAGEDGSLRLLGHHPYTLSEPLQPPAASTAGEIIAMTELQQGHIVSAQQDIENDTKGFLCWWDITSWVQNTLVSDCKHLPGNAKPTALMPQASKNLLVSASSDGILRWWNAERKVAKESPSVSAANKTTSVEAIIPGNHGGFITGDSDGRIYWWDSQGNQDGQAVQWTAGPVVKLRLLALSKNRFVSVGFFSAAGGFATEQLSWWRNRKPDKPQTLAHSRLTSWVRLDDNQITTGGDEGSLQLWTNGKRDGELVKTGLQSITAQIVLKESPFEGFSPPPLLMTGGEEGKVEIWNTGLRKQPSSPQLYREVLVTGQKGAITSLIQTSDGDLVSGSRDGSIKVLSPRKVVRAACELYAPLMNNAPNSSEHKAAVFCASQVPENWWDGMGWLRYIWNYLVS